MRCKTPDVCAFAVPLPLSAPQSSVAIKVVLIALEVRLTCSRSSFGLQLLTIARVNVLFANVSLSAEGGRLLALSSTYRESTAPAQQSLKVPRAQPGCPVPGAAG